MNRVLSHFLQATQRGHQLSVRGSGLASPERDVCGLPGQCLGKDSEGARDGRSGNHHVPVASIQDWWPKSKYPRPLPPPADSGAVTHGKLGPL